MKRVPIRIIEREMPAGLPIERVYSCSPVGTPVGTVVLPPGLVAHLFSGMVRLLHDNGPGRYTVLCCSLTVSEAVAAAVNGDFGLSWGPGPERAGDVVAQISVDIPNDNQ